MGLTAEWCLLLEERSPNRRCELVDKHLCCSRRRPFVAFFSFNIVMVMVVVDCARSNRSSKRSANVFKLAIATGSSHLWAGLREVEVFWMIVGIFCLSLYVENIL